MNLMSLGPSSLFQSFLLYSPNDLPRAFTYCLYVQLQRTNFMGTNYSKTNCISSFDRRKRMNCTEISILFYMAQANANVKIKTTAELGILVPRAAFFLPVSLGVPLLDVSAPGLLAGPNPLVGVPAH
jgi:hypothetical protein